MSDAFMQAVDKNGNAIAIGTFISIAEKFSKIIDLDKGVISRVVKRIKTEKVEHAIAISLSARTLKNSDFRVWLTKSNTSGKAGGLKTVNRSKRADSLSTQGCKGH
jgi:EAL domain-containing protein (putative c-di-GMP-specific phosphodiesterase class I)